MAEFGPWESEIRISFNRDAIGIAAHTGGNTTEKVLFLS
jgi:hypothetical protein